VGLKRRSAKWLCPMRFRRLQTDGRSVVITTRVDLTLGSGVVEPLDGVSQRGSGDPELVGEFLDRVRPDRRMLGEIKGRNGRRAVSAGRIGDRVRTPAGLTMDLIG